MPCEVPVQSVSIGIIPKLPVVGFCLASRIPAFLLKEEQSWANGARQCVPPYLVAYLCRELGKRGNIQPNELGAAAILFGMPKYGAGRPVLLNRSA
jgi:hypothetical protein